MIETTCKMSYLLLQEDIVAVRFVGDYRTADGFRRRMAAMQVIPEHRRRKTFVDLTRMGNSDMRGADMVHTAISQQQITDAMGFERRVALYSPSDGIAYNLSRMYEAFCHSSDLLQVRTFDDADAALAWLGGTEGYAALSEKSGWTDF